MSMKECPSCGASVPTSASRCKTCFHDFDEAPPANNGGPIFLLGAAAIMAVLGALTLWWVTSSPLEEHILVDEETQSVVWTRKYRAGVETERLPFVDVATVEYVVNVGSFEVVAVTHGGGRKILSEDLHPIKNTADRYAKLMKKPLVEVDNTRFGEVTKGD